MDNSAKIQHLEGQLSRDPHSTLFVQLAEEYRKAGEYQKALEVCREGLTKHPGYISARVTLGHILLDQDALEAAQYELEAVIGQAPDNLKANNIFAEVYHRSGRLDDALEKYRIVQMLNPSDSKVSVLR